MVAGRNGLGGPSAVLDVVEAFRKDLVHARILRLLTAEIRAQATLFRKRIAHLFVQVVPLLIQLNFK